MRDSADAFAPCLLKVDGEKEVSALPAGFDHTCVEKHPFGVDFNGLIGHWCRGVFVEPPADALRKVAFRERGRTGDEIAEGRWSRVRR